MSSSLKIDVPAYPGENLPVPAAGPGPLKIVFMGTPDFSVHCLQALLDSENDVISVVAQPDKPAGRGKKIKRPPTVELADKVGIKTRQPRGVRSGPFPERLGALNADLFVVVAYGRILPKAILAMPKYGCINVHASLLPAYRGAGPIQRAILEGDKKTGVTTMFMDVGMDTGDMLRTSELTIDPQDTAQTLHDKLGVLGAELLISTIKHLKAGTLTRTQQNHDMASHAPMLAKKDGVLDWSKPAQEIDWHVRGMSPWPGAYGFRNSQRFVIVEGEPRPGDIRQDANAGQVVEAGKEGIVVQTGLGTYCIKTIKPAGKRAMSARDYLLGKPIEAGAILG